MKKHCIIVYIKADEIYKDIAEDVETRFDTSNYELDRPLPKGKTKQVIGLMKDELGRKIMTKFLGLRAKTCIYLTNDGSEDKKAKGTKKCVIKRKIKFENYRNSLEATKLKKNHEKFIRNNKSIIKTQQRFKSESHNVLLKKLIRLR